MSDAINRDIYAKLSVPEKIKLVQDIWDDIARRPDEVEVSSEQAAEAERRLLEHEANPSDVEEWEVVRRRIEGGE
jgi:putative addiction module component (TIGR02574 family)